MEASGPRTNPLAEMFLGGDQKVARQMGARGFEVREVRGPDGERIFIAAIPA